jgi:hypothetical protein
MYYPPSYSFTSHSARGEQTILSTHAIVGGAITNLIPVHPVLASAERGCAVGREHDAVVDLRGYYDCQVGLSPEDISGLMVDSGGDQKLVMDRTSSR